MEKPVIITFPGFWGFLGFLGFWVSGIWPFSGIPREGPSSGQIRDLAEIWQIWGSGPGSRIRVFGVQNPGFPGSQIRGKSTLSATMVSVVSTSRDPDFDEDLEILRKSGVPARKKRAPGTPKSGRFRGPGTPDSGAQIWQFSGSGARFRDFGVRGQISGFRGFGQISGFRVPWDLKRRF